MDKGGLHFDAPLCFRAQYLPLFMVHECGLDEMTWPFVLAGHTLKNSIQLNLNPFVASFPRGPVYFSRLVSRYPRDSLLN